MGGLRRRYRKDEAQIRRVGRRYDDPIAEGRVEAGSAQGAL